MNNDVIHLKYYYNFLGEDGCDPVVELLLPYNMMEMNRQNDKRPCMVICPGGGYSMCSERESEPIGLNFLSEGFNVFIIKYSVAPHHFPQQLREVAALMELIYVNADKWNCNTEKISIIGFSAGGHLAAQYTTMYDCKEIREVFPESKPVNASLLCYPVITALPEYAHMGSIINLIGHEPESKQQTEYFSCECHVDTNTPPTFIWHTASDSCVPVNNSLLYAQALDKNKVPFELHIYPYGNHGLATSDNQTCDDTDESIIYDHCWIESAKKWLRLTFKL